MHSMTRTKIQDFRQTLGLSRSVVSMLSGVSLQKIANFEQGDGDLSPADLQSIRDVLLQFIAKRSEQVERLRSEIVAI